MARMVKCVKLQRELPGLEFKPFPNDLGQRIYDSVSQEAWKMWLEHFKMIMNEYRLARGSEDAPVCFFGLYAELNSEHLLERHADSVIGAEADVPLRLLAAALERGVPGIVPGVRTAGGVTRLAREKLAPAVPSRAGLPVLDRYWRVP